MSIKYGNTGYLVFTVSEESTFDLSLVDKVLFTFGKGSRQIIKEYPREVRLYNGRSFLVSFSQEDTYRFKEGDSIEYDVKFVLKTGDVVSSEIGEVEIEEVVNKKTYEV